MSGLIPVSSPTGFRPLLKTLSAPLPFSSLSAQTVISTATVVQGVQNVSAYNHHPFLTLFNGQFWAMFSTGAVNEDVSGQIVRYATSFDGLTWSAASALTPAPASGFRYTAQGWLIAGSNLYALVALDEAGTHYGPSLQMLSLLWNGSSFNAATQFMNNYICAFPPLPLPSGNFAVIGRNHDLSQVTLNTGQPGAWTGRVVTQPSRFQLDEGCIAVLPDGSLAITYRDNAATPSHRILTVYAGAASGAPTVPKMTNFPDAQAKICQFALSNGVYVLANNPDIGGSRIPLCLSISSDGQVYDRVRILQSAATSPRYAGTNKNPGYQYPSMFEVGGNLYVIYSVNKEDIWVTKIAVSAIT